jgi:hypothetical protein
MHVDLVMADGRPEYVCRLCSKHCEGRRVVRWMNNKMDNIMYFHIGCAETLLIKMGELLVSNRDWVDEERDLAVNQW